VAEIVAVLVSVVAPVAVAVHLNGNATVGVIGRQELPESSWLGLYRKCAGRVIKADKARHYTIARGSAMESAAHLDVLKVGGTIDEQQYPPGIQLLERVVAMLTKLIHP